MARQSQVKSVQEKISRLHMRLVTSASSLQLWPAAATAPAATRRPCSFRHIVQVAGRPTAYPQHHVRAGTMLAGWSIGCRGRGLTCLQMALPHLCCLLTCGT